MAVPASTQQLIDEIKAATDEDAKILEDARQKISTQMSQEDVDNVNGQLTGVRDHLKAMGTDPNNPVPAPPAAASAQKGSTGRSPTPQVGRGGKSQS